MCAIVDANVAWEVFGTGRPEAGAKFFEWIDTGKGRLVVGGRIAEELGQSARFREWAKNAQLAGRLHTRSQGVVAERTEAIESQGLCTSNDAHILALAQVSGARLLYSNDQALQSDFKSSILIDTPRGKVHSTRENRSFTDAHRRLLSNRTLCRR